MIDRLGATRFLAVLGSSGTGKSSLVQTGLISGLEMGMLGRARSHWRIVDFRPRGAPLRNLARRLLATELQETHGTIAKPDEIEIEFLSARLKREPWSLFRWCQEGHLPKGTNLLLLVDQFEELFRYQTYADREEAEAFVARLLEIKRPPSFIDAITAKSIYVTLTMRSEFLGACSLIENLAEAINEGTFLTPRMTREECREAIEGPAEISAIEIEETLVNRLLNDLASFASWSDGGREGEPGKAGEDQLSRLARRADQLPLMQHALNRMWEEANGGIAASYAPRAKSSPIKLTLSNYEGIGGLQGALDKHANAVLAKLKATLGTARCEAATKMIFRAVTAGTTIADAVRRPTRFGELVRICGDDRAAVHAAVDAFRAEGCNFLQPEIDPDKPALEDTELVDITHESLIRQWTQLREWAREEFEAAETYRRLLDAAKRSKDGRGELWTKLDLGQVVAWRGHDPINVDWAARYGGDFELAMEFLERSQEAERQKAEEELEDAKREAARAANLLREREAATREREKAATRFRIAIGSGLAILLLGITGSFLVFTGYLARERQTTIERLRLELEVEQHRTLAKQNFELAVSSAQKLLDQVVESLNHGDLTVRSARDILKLAGAIVDRVQRGDTPEATELIVKLLWTASGIHGAMGDLTQAYEGAKSARELILPLLQANPDDPKVLSLLYNSTWRMGDAIADRDLQPTTQERALGEYLEAERLARRLVAMAPGDGGRQRNVVFTLQKIGDVYQGLQNWPRSIATYRDALMLMQRVVASNPGNRVWQRDLANTFSRLGQALAGNGELDAAMEQFREALRIRTELVQTDRNDDVLQSNLATSYRDIARLYARRGDLDAALAEYRRAIGIRDNLLIKDPANATWQ